MIDQNLNIKIIDFGISSKLYNVFNLLAGSPGFMAPEVINDRMPDFKSDVFSLGVVFYIMLTAEIPFFSDVYCDDIMELNKRCDIRYEDKVFSTMTRSGFNLLKSMLDVFPGDRISVKAALNSQWFYQRMSSMTQTSEGILPIIKLPKYLTEDLDSYEKFGPMNSTPSKVRYDQFCLANQLKNQDSIKSPVITPTGMLRKISTDCQTIYCDSESEDFSDDEIPSEETDEDSSPVSRMAIYTDARNQNLNYVP